MESALNVLKSFILIFLILLIITRKVILTRMNNAVLSTVIYLLVSTVKFVSSGQVGHIIRKEVNHDD